MGAWLGNSAGERQPRSRDLRPFSGLGASLGFRSKAARDAVCSASRAPGPDTSPSTTTACFRRTVMLSRFTPFDRTMALMDEWRRRMDRAFDDFQVPFAPSGTFDDPWSLSEATWPRATLHDTGNSLRFTAEVPGLGAKDVQIQLENDVLTVSGERKVQV